MYLVSHLAGCSSDESGSDQPPAADAGADAAPVPPTYTLDVDEAGVRITLQRDGEALLVLGADGIQLGRVDAVSDSANYDPWLLVAGTAPADTVPRWLSVQSMNERAAGEVELVFDEQATAILTLSERTTGRYEARLEPGAGIDTVAYYRLRARVDAAEGFYGLGEYFDEVNHRGKDRPMQIELDATIESSYNEAHVPVPFVIGTRGWGLFVESYFPGAFQVASEAADTVVATFGTGTASSDGLAFHLFGSEHPLDVTRHYYEVTGYPALPAPWALGPWIWRNENADQAQVESDLNTIRDLDLATTGYWIDRPYATAVNTFDFEAARFPDPQGMITLMHRLGFKTALWHTPYIDPDDPNAAALRTEAETQGFFPLQIGLVISNWGEPIDLTNPDAYVWWQGLIRRYTDMGVAGFKLDYGEEIAPGLPGFRNVWRFFDGSDERTMHAQYQLFYHRVYAETLPADGGFLLCRAGRFGDQKHVSVIWPGDLDASFARHREPAPDGGPSYVGGLPASVVAGLSLGPSGFPFYGADTGGYRDSPPDEETFIRWFEQTALSTVMQVGTGSSTVAWELAENGFTQQTLDLYRVYTRLHLRLWPYEWTYAQRLREDGRPIQRALGLAYPELGVHPSDTYLFGDHLLVAPVLDRGVRQREVMLPPGGWVDFWTGERLEGAQSVVLDAPLETLPLLLRAGGIVPLLRPTIETLNPTMEPERVDSYATSAGVLFVRTAPGPDTAFAVFDGTELRQRASADALLLDITPGSDFVLGAVFEVLGLAAAPAAVRLDGQALDRLPDASAVADAASGWFYGSDGMLSVKVPPGEHQVEALPR